MCTCTLPKNSYFSTINFFNWVLTSCFTPNQSCLLSSNVSIRKFPGHALPAFTWRAASSRMSDGAAGWARSAFGGRRAVRADLGMAWRGTIRTSAGDVGRMVWSFQRAKWALDFVRRDRECPWDARGISIMILGACGVAQRHPS